METLKVPCLRVGPSDLAVALDKWQADMERRGCKARSVTIFTGRVRMAAAACGWAAPADLDYAGAVGWLAKVRAEKGWSGTTHDCAVSALRCFGRFCHAAGLVPMDPFLALNRSGEVGGAGERALTIAEVRRLVVIGSAASARDRRARCPRGLYYGFLALTGLRAAESAACCWGDLDTAGDPPALWSNPAWAKNGKRQRVVLATQLLPLLERWRKCVPSGRGDPVFPEVPNRGTFRKDREAAGIPEVDARGRRCGLHSLRKAFATALYETGASEATIARLMRHADGITLSRYVDPDPALEVAAVEKIPQILSDSQVVWSQTLRDRQPERTVKIGSEAVENSPHFDDSHGATTLTTANTKPAPVLRKSSHTEPHGSGSGLCSGGGVRPGASASAAGREGPSGPSRVGNPRDSQVGSGYFRPANARVLDLLARAAADLAAAVRSLGQLAEVCDGDERDDEG